MVGLSILKVKMTLASSLSQLVYDQPGEILVFLIKTQLQLFEMIRLLNLEL